jgi:hypothetical protein
MSDRGDNICAGTSSWPHSRPSTQVLRPLDLVHVDLDTIEITNKLHTHDHDHRHSFYRYCRSHDHPAIGGDRLHFAHQDARRSSAAGSNGRRQTNVRANAGRTRARRAGHRRAARGWSRFGARAIVRSADRSTLAVHAQRAGILVDLPSRWHRAVWPSAAGRARHRRMPRSGGGCRGSSFTIVRWPDASDFLRLRTRNRPRTWPGGCS